MPGQSPILDEHWTGILPLAPPQSVTVWMLLSSAVLFFLVMAVVYFLWRRSPRQQALRTLRHCYQQLQTSAADTKQIAQTVFRSFLQGMALNPANTNAVAEYDEKNWQIFYTRLQHCVFQLSPPATDELGELIQQASEWLRRGLR